MKFWEQHLYIILKFFRIGSQKLHFSSDQHLRISFRMKSKTEDWRKGFCSDAELRIRKPSDQWTEASQWKVLTPLCTDYEEAFLSYVLFIGQQHGSMNKVQKRIKHFWEPYQTYCPMLYGVFQEVKYTYWNTSKTYLYKLKSTSAWTSVYKYKASHKLQMAWKL